MPQTAYSLHIFVRFGGYEPSTSIHLGNDSRDPEPLLNAILPEFKAMIPATVAIPRFEYQDAAGVVLYDGVIASVGTNSNSWQDFADCTYISWASAGPKGNSGHFVHPRPGGAYVSGAPSVAWEAIIQNWVGAVVNIGATDSEGFGIQGIRRHRPSRRRRVRLAP